MVNFQPTPINSHGEIFFPNSNDEMLLNYARTSEEPHVSQRKLS